MATLKEKAATLDIVIEQGATFSTTATWKDSNGTPIDLTGCTANLKIKKSKTSLSYIHEMAVGSGITITPLSGVIVIVIDALTTASFNFETAVYDLEITHPDSSVTRLMKGTVTLDREVTK